MPFSKEQRDWIVARDDGRSQMRHYDEDRGWHLLDCEGCQHRGRRESPPLQVHHILPQRNGGRDIPTNGITLNECEHNGRACDGSIIHDRFIVHTDTAMALYLYRDGNKYAYLDMMDVRNQALMDNRIYHCPDHDEEMFETAIERTLIYISSGHKWPQKYERTR